MPNADHAMMLDSEAEQRLSGLTARLEGAFVAEDFGPFDFSSLEGLLGALSDHDKGLLLAVSGGPDSLALVLICYAWQLFRRAQGQSDLPLYLASVDHGLRPEARYEVHYVGKVAKALGLSHHILTWEGEKPQSNLQALARKARYDLLAAHARSLGVRHIVTAHHCDDQAETFIMRLLRGSSVRGLSAMGAVRPLGDLRLIRPLLSYQKADLKALLEHFDVAWCEDPSNDKLEFDRVCVRKTLMPVLADFGADGLHLSRTAARLARAESALQQVTQAQFDALMVPVLGRALRCSLADYCCLAEEFRLRLLQEALFHVGGPGYPAKEQSLVALDCDLCRLNAAYREGDTKEGLVRKRTLGGCCFVISRQALWIYRELGRKPIAHRIEAGQCFDWQGIGTFRYPDALQDDASDRTLILKPLGQEGRLLLLHSGLLSEESASRLVDMPAALIEAVPSGWCKDRLDFVLDLPEFAKVSGCGLEFLEKNTRFTKNG